MLTGTATRHGWLEMATRLNEQENSKGRWLLRSGRRTDEEIREGKRGGAG